MKKILLGMAAFSMLFAASCESNLEDGINAGNQATVAFSVNTPEMGRSFSDGASATVLQYAVYEDGVELSDLTVTNGEIHGSTTVEMQLTTGNTYSVIFWAAAPNAPYTVDFANKTMTVNYNGAVSNAENRDAFYKYEEFTVSGNGQLIPIKMTRPFAQLNIGTDDFEAAKKSGYEPTKSMVKVSKIYDTLNFVDGTVTGETAVTFDYEAIPQGETFPVAGDYEYLAMNYLLVEKKVDAALIEVEFGYTETDATAEKTRTVGSVPVNRNHRTNIYGSLLTSKVKINVSIDEVYDDPAYTADALFHAAAFGGEVTLTEDVVLTAPLKIQNNVSINLNGKTISGAVAKGVGAVIEIAEGATAEIFGGAIASTVENGDAAINNAGNLVLQDVTITGAPLADGGYSAYAVISSGKLVIEEGTVVSADRGCLKFSGEGETVIYGGHFTNNDIAPISLTSHVVDVEDGGSHKLTIYGGKFEHLNAATSGGVVICNRTRGTVYVNGGNYSGGNYYGNNNLSDYGYGGTFAVTGGVYTSKPAAKYIVAGYKAIEKDGRYYVVEDVIDTVAASVADVKAALEAGENVALADDILVASSETVSNGYGAMAINQTNGGVIDGNGHAFGVNAWGTWDCAINTTGGTIKNLMVNSGMRGIFVSHNSTNNSKVILENVIIDGTIYTISCDQGTNQGLDATDSVFCGWTSYAATIGEVKFTDCLFGEGQGYAFCRPYAPTTFVNCEFEAGFQVDACAAVTFENCTLDGVQLTAANIDTLVVDGVEKVTVK